MLNFSNEGAANFTATFKIKMLSLLNN